MSTRKLWKVTQAGQPDARPESKAKAYDIYVANARRAYRPGTAQIVTVYIDERDGRGWQVYEHVDVSEGETT